MSPPLNLGGDVRAGPLEALRTGPLEANLQPGSGGAEAVLRVAEMELRCVVHPATAEVEHEGRRDSNGQAAKIGFVVNWRGKKRHIVFP